MRLVLALSLALLAQAADRNWVGSQECASCHNAIYRSYSRTPMAASSGPVGGGLIEEQFDRAAFAHQRSGFSYQVEREDGGYLYDFQGSGASSGMQGRRKLDYFVGSGAVARSYLTSVDGFLFEAPVAYYSESGRWDLPPGYDQYPYVFLTRPVLRGCLLCHASQLQPVENTHNGFESPPFLEGGVSCERCHGPGSAHIAKIRSGRLEGGLEIVNPAKLDAERRDSVCAQCHVAGDVRVMRAGKEQEPLLAGERLSDYFTVFQRVGGTAGMKVRGHVEKLAQSACQRASGDKMWCGSCHDPHAVPAPEERAAWYRGKCLQCHEQNSCTSPAAARQANGGDCTACHMPRSPVTDAEHVVYTDHSIPRRLDRQGVEPPADAPLAVFGAGQASMRDQGLAYAIAAQGGDIPAYRDRAFDLLRQAVAAGSDDSQTLLYLADLHRERSGLDAAAALYERAIQADPSQLTGSVALGGIRMLRGDTAEAMRLWRDALAKNPGLVFVRLNLAGALMQSGRTAEAREVLEKALEFYPTLAPAREMLEQIRKLEGR